MTELADPAALREAMAAAEELGIKLETQDGLPLWEVMPSPAHTIRAQRIERSVQGSAFTYRNLYIRFPGGSHRRPDLALFGEEVPATQEAATLLPGAVVEIVLPGSEIKDLQLAPPFYLAQGVRDVLVLDPRAEIVHHHRRDAARRLPAGSESTLEMGCRITV